MMKTACMELPEPEHFVQRAGTGSLVLSSSTADENALVTGVLVGLEE